MTSTPLARTMTQTITRARTRARFLRGRFLRARRRPIGVFARLGALEAEVQEQRQLQRRLAELTDVVAELLVPLTDRHEEWTREVVERYRVGL